MSNVNYATCLKSEKYRGFYIDKNVSDEFGTIYYSIINPKKNTYIHSQLHKVHVHADKESTAKKIVDCFYSRNKVKFGRSIRNKAMSLNGIRVLY